MILIGNQDGEPLFWHQLSRLIDNLGRGQRLDPWDREKNSGFNRTQEQKLRELHQVTGGPREGRRGQGVWVSREPASLARSTKTSLSY